MKHFHPDTFQNCTLGLFLGRTAMLKDRIIDRHMEPFGITAAQFKVLIIMAQFDVDTPAELCRHLSLDSGSMTRMLDRLEQEKSVDTPAIRVSTAVRYVWYSPMTVRHWRPSLPQVGADARSTSWQALSARKSCKA